MNGKSERVVYFCDISHLNDTFDIFNALCVCDRRERDGGVREIQRERGNGSRFDNFIAVFLGRESSFSLLSLIK